MFRSIWSKSLRDYRVPILSWGIGLSLLMAIIFTQATPGLRAAYVSILQSYRFFGDPYAAQTIEGFITTRYLELLLPLLLSIWPILVAARMLRGEEERGTLDVILATPQGRVRIIMEKILALLVALVFIALLMALGIVVGEAKTSSEVNVARALFATLNLSLVAFCFAMLALLISQFTNSRGTAAAWASSVMIVAFLFDGTGRVVSGAWVQYLSPFYYYNLNRPLIPSFNDTPLSVLVLVGVSLVCAAGSVILFTRRDSGRPLFTVWDRHTNGHQQVERSLQKAERDVSVRTIGLRALYAQRRSAFWWLAGILVWCGWLVVLIPSIQQPLKKAVAQSPNLARLFGGADIGTNAGFLNGLVFAFAIVFVVIFAMTLALNWASDLENGRLELLLGTPRSRTRMMLERFGAILLLLVLAPLFAWLAIVVGAQKASLSIDQGKVIAASFSMLPPALVVVGLVYALAGRLRYSAVLGILAGYIVLAFLVDFLQALLQLPDWLLSLSIFHLYGQPIIDGIHWSTFLGMIGVAVVLLAIGLVQFHYIDIERG